MIEIERHIGVTYSPKATVSSLLQTKCVNQHPSPCLLRLSKPKISAAELSAATPFRL
jgi:hypothetical protein